MTTKQGVTKGSTQGGKPLPWRVSRMLGEYSDREAHTDQDTSSCQETWTDLAVFSSKNGNHGFHRKKRTFHRTHFRITVNIKRVNEISQRVKTMVALYCIHPVAIPW